MKDIKKAITLLEKALKSLESGNKSRASKAEARESVLAAIGVLSKAVLGPDLGPDKNPGTRG